MKSKFQCYSIALLSTILLTAFINKPVTVSNDCDSYFPISKGASFELTSYDKKDKKTSLVKHTIIESKTIENGIATTAEMVISDTEGNQPVTMMYDSKCQNGEYHMNMESMFSSLTSQYEAQGMDVTIENGIAVIPNNLTVGDKLEDSSMSMKVSMSGFDMSMNVLVTDREIIGQESQTTPAGTFDCIIMTQKTTIKMGGLSTVTTSSKTWLAKGVGSVRSEDYNKRGKLESYTLLTKFSK